MSTIIPFINAMGENIAYYPRLYGARDAETGWPKITNITVGDFLCGDFDGDDFVLTPCVIIWIKAMIRELATIVRDTPEGRLEEQRGRMYTGTAVEMRDRIEYVGYLWEIEDVQFTHVLLGVAGYYDCTLIRLDAVS